MRTAREELKLRAIPEVRVDSGFFQQDFLASCDRTGVEYAVKVPMWPWLNLRKIVTQKNECARAWVDWKSDLQGLFAKLPIPRWGRTERIAIFRKRVNHKPAKGRQLELFNPDDGYWEYSVVATNKNLGLRPAFSWRPQQPKNRARPSGQRSTFSAA